MANYTIGVQVSCVDGSCGELTRVVINPLARTLTHLVVKPKHGLSQARLVPVDLVDDASAEEIHLCCTAAKFAELEDAEETHFLPEASEHIGYEAGQVLSWPYYGLGGAGTAGVVTPLMVTEDRVPAGEVNVRRGEHVQASDGDIGRVQGLVIDPKDQHVTHVLLQEGHLWGKKQVAIPIGAVKDVTADGVQVNLTKDEVRDLRPVNLAHHS